MVARDISFQMSEKMIPSLAILYDIWDFLELNVNIIAVRVHVVLFYVQNKFEV